MLICVLSLCCGGVAADVRYDFALLPLYGVRLVVVHTFALLPLYGVRLVTDTMSALLYPFSCARFTPA